MSNQLPDEEQRLLQHYRQLSDEQPPAALDARILAAARAQVAQPRASWLVRLGQWLHDASLAQRSSLAFGSLASVALVLGLVWQGLPQREQGSEQFSDLQEQSARAPVQVMQPGVMPKQLMDPPAMAAAPVEQRRLARPAPAPAAPPAALAAKPEPREPVRKMTAAGIQAEAQAQLDEAAAAELDVALLEILQLREAGRAEEAERLLGALRERHAEEALQARLSELERQHKARP